MQANPQTILPCSIKSAINARTEVLANLPKYNIAEIYRPTLENNLKYFQEKLAQRTEYV